MLPRRIQPPYHAGAVERMPAPRFAQHRAGAMDAPAPPVTTTLLLRGGRALSAFRRERLLRRVRMRHPSIAGIDGRWIHIFSARWWISRTKSMDSSH